MASRSVLKGPVKWGHWGRWGQVWVDRDTPCQTIAHRAGASLWIVLYTDPASGSPSAPVSR
jgi:hypothetical protein